LRCPSYSRANYYHNRAHLHTILPIIRIYLERKKLIILTSFYSCVHIQNLFILYILNVFIFHVKYIIYSKNYAISTKRTKDLSEVVQL
jgi:hypothetical protein